MPVSGSEQQNVHSDGFCLDLDMDNKSLPLEYKFDFVIDEISNINDKSQVNLDIIEFSCHSW